MRSRRLNRSRAPGTAPVVLIVHPSAELYGSDLQVVETVRGLCAAGARVVLALPGDGELANLARCGGATVIVSDYPVLRRAYASATGVLRLLAEVAASAPRMWRLIRSTHPRALLVNTSTLPWWLAIGRAARVHNVVCHLHEAEAQESRAMLYLLDLPLLLADRVIVNSRSTRRVLLDVVPALAGRSRLVYNGVEGPAAEVGPPPGGSTEVRRLAVVGRLSPRKATHVALEAMAILRSRGFAVELDVCGTAYEGYEWYERDLRELAAALRIAEYVHWRGYVRPMWPVLRQCSLVLAPSLGESFGNAVIEAQLAARPVVATRVSGHAETVRDGVTGLLVPASDPRGMADAAARLLQDRHLADRLAVGGRRSARAGFGVDRYRREAAEVVLDAVALTTGEDEYVHS